MINIAKAQLWELWRTSRLELAFRMVFLLCMASVLVAGHDLLDDPQIRVIRGVATMLLLITGVFSAGWINGLDSRSTGFSFRHQFVKPVSIWQLTIIPFLWLLFTSTACIASTCFVISFIAGIEMPVTGIAFIAMLGVAFFATVVWSAASLVGKWACVLIATTLASILAYQWHHSHVSSEPLLMRLGDLDYWRFSLNQFATGATLILVCVLWTVHAVGRQRCGEPAVKLPWSLTRQRIRLPRLSALFWKPRSPVEAQFWYEIRRVAPPMLIAIWLPGLTLLFIVIGDHFYPNRIAGPSVWAVAIVVSPVVYQIVALDSVSKLRSEDGEFRLSLFDAVRPMRCDTLVVIKLAVVVLATLGGWSVMLMAAYIHSRTGSQIEYWAKYTPSLIRWAETVPPWAWPLAVIQIVFLFLYICLTSMAGVFWMGRHPRWLMAAAIFTTVHVVAAVAAARLVWFKTWWTIEGYAGVMIALVAIGLVVGASLRSGWLSKPWFIGFAGLWAVSISTNLMLVWRSWDSLPVHPSALGIALTAVSIFVPLAAAAAAPWTLAMHRHQ